MYIIREPEQERKTQAIAFDLCLFLMVLLISLQYTSKIMKSILDHAPFHEGINIEIIRRLMIG